MNNNITGTYIDHPYNDNILIKVTNYMPYKPPHICCSADDSYDAEGELSYEIVDFNRNPVEWDIDFEEEEVIMSAVVGYMQCN